MLSTAELQGMQATMTASLPDLCTIDHVSRVTDGAGGTTGSVESTPEVPCRYAEVTDRREGFLEGDVIFGNPVWLFSFTAGTDIAVVDLIHVNDRTFEVQIVFERSWELDRRVICREQAS